MKIEYHPALEQELQDVIDFYNERSKGLGTDFLNEFDRQVLKIAENPLQWTAVEDGVRRSMIKRFPFVIYFRIIEQNWIRITVVKHQRRHPIRGINRR